MAKKVLRTIMPAHPGGSITVEQAMEAFRKVQAEARERAAKRKARKPARSNEQAGSSEE